MHTWMLQQLWLAVMPMVVATSEMEISPLGDSTTRMSLTTASSSADAFYARIEEWQVQHLGIFGTRLEPAKGLRAFAFEHEVVPAQGWAPGSRRSGGRPDLLELIGIMPPGIWPSPGTAPPSLRWAGCS